MPEKTHMYEIVPVDPISKLHKKTSSLEEDIREIKSALRGTVGLSKLESNADEFIKNMLNLMNSSQKMVEEVAESNQQVATKIQAAIDRMNRANEELSKKLTQILNFFAQATDAMGGEEGGVPEALTTSLKDLKTTMDKIAGQGELSNKVLQSMERQLKRQAVRRPVQPPMMPPPQMLPPPGAPPMMPSPGAPPASRAPQKKGAPELPPPPFPP